MKIKIVTLHFHLVWSYRWLCNLLDAEMLVYLLGVSCVLRLTFFVSMYVFENNGDNDFVQLFDAIADPLKNFIRWCRDITSQYK